METISGIYQITSPTHRRYIGLSTDIYKRWEAYKYPCNVKSQKLIYRSLKKYGSALHSFEILEILPRDIKLLEEREIYWIDKKNSFYQNNKRFGLNLTKGGNYPQKQIKPKSEDHKLKIGKANKGKKRSVETIDKIKVARAKQVFTLEQRQRRTESLKKPCYLVNKITGEILKAKSVQELAKLSGFCMAHLYTIRNKETKIFRLQYGL